MQLAFVYKMHVNPIPLRFLGCPPVPSPLFSPMKFSGCQIQRKNFIQQQDDSFGDIFPSNLLTIIYPRLIPLYLKFIPPVVCMTCVWKEACMSCVHVFCLQN